MEKLKIKNKQCTYKYSFLLASLWPKETGLPMEIHVKPCTGEKHLPILHVNKKYGVIKGFCDWVTVTIENEPKVYGKGLSKEDVYLVCEYIRLNKRPLLRYWKDEIGIGDFFKETRLLERAKIFERGKYSLWVYSEPLKTPCFRLKHKTDFEIILRIDNLKVLEVRHDEGKYGFNKNKLPSKPILDLINEFLALPHKHLTKTTNKQALEFIWDSINYNNPICEKRTT